MKNYRFLVPIVMISLMALSWYVLISDSISLETEYNSYLSKAREYAESDLTKYAIENYNLALEVKKEADVYVEVAEFYKSQGKNSEYLDWCENFFDEYPTEPKAYDSLLEAYLSENNYESCYDVLETASKRNISTEYIEQVSEEIRYVFKLDFNTYEDVSIYSNNFCAVKSKGAWGFVDRYGSVRITCKYSTVGAYTQSNFTSVVNSDKDAYFIDKSGAKVITSKGDYKCFGLLANGIIAAQKDDDKYVYVDQKLNVLFGEYDYASTMNNNVGAVKIGETWQLINESGEAITESKYLDVKLDEKQIAYRNDRLFVSNEAGKYIMIDGKGNQIGKLQFEDAHVFAGPEATAVKIAGKWCFIDAEGNLISNRTYNEARAFNNGLAAVCIDGKWGFVDLDEKVVIEPQFFGAKDFNAKGSCFVQTGDKWQLLKMYRLNREG